MVDFNIAPLDFDLEEFADEAVKITDPLEAQKFLQKLFGDISVEELDSLVDTFISQINQFAPDQGVCDLCFGTKYIQGKRSNKLICPKCLGRIYI